MRLWQFAAVTVPAVAAPLTGALLFRDDAHVEELYDGVDLAHFLFNSVGPGPGCERSAFVMLYSAWCPHCHAFQPVWSSVAARLNCTRNQALRVGAFECVSEEPQRMVPLRRWREAIGSDFVFSQRREKLISPREVCQSVLYHSYPTLLLVTPPECELDGMWHEFHYGSGGVKWKDNFPVDARMYHVSVESHSTAADDLIEGLEDANIAADCTPAAHEKAASNKKIADYLRELGKTVVQPSHVVNSPNTRWDEKAQAFDAHKRLHDAILGFYHILSSWVPAEQHTDQHLDAVANFLLFTAAAYPGLNERRTLIETILDLQTNRKVPETPILSSVPLPKDPGQPQGQLCETSSCHVWTLFHTLFTLLDTYDQQEETNYVKLFGSEENGHSDNKADNATNNTTTMTRLKELIEDDKSLSSLSIRGSDGARVMHDIVWTFFNCRSCRDHFHRGFESCLADRCQWVQSHSPQLTAMINEEDDAPPGFNVTESFAAKLWLWRFHNIVNVRTATDKAMLSLRTQFEAGNDRPKIDYLDQDVRIPTMQQCMECRHARHPTPQPRDPNVPEGFVAPAQLIDAPWLLQFLESNENEDAMPYDQVEDFSFIKVNEFLTNFYTDPSWRSQPLQGLKWNNTNNQFIEDEKEKKSQEEGGEGEGGVVEKKQEGVEKKEESENAEPVKGDDEDKIGQEELKQDEVVNLVGNDFAIIQLDQVHEGMSRSALGGLFLGTGLSWLVYLVYCGACRMHAPVADNPPPSSKMKA